MIGAGIAGLMSAIRIKETDPDVDLMVVDKEKPTGNTQISGLRFRQKNISEHMIMRNGGGLTQEIKLFASIASEELDRLSGFLPNENRSEWFGPQFMGGIGALMLEKLRKTAIEIGVVFIRGDVVRLIRENNRIIGAVTEDKKITADMIILANGTAMGELFFSTNRPIKHSAHMLAFQAGLPLQDSTVHMFHPFGRCDYMGKPQMGCFETDKLAGAKVSYLTGNKDDEITEILKDHKAHDSFPEISQKILRNGGIVRLDFPDGSSRYARVLHHYGHMGIITEDGVKVKDMENVLAVGDASNLGYWTNHKERLPGTALLKCLVDARIAADHVSAMPVSEKVGNFKLEKLSQEEVSKTEIDHGTGCRFKEINTEMLFLMNFGNENRAEKAAKWVEKLDKINGRSLIAQLSYEIAKTHYLLAKQPELREPVSIVKEGSISRKEISRPERYL